MDPITISSPMEADWTFEALIEAEIQPLVAGNDWQIRLQFRDEDDAAVSLSAALIIWTITTTDVDQTVLLTRRSDTNITGSSPARKQIQVDADQVTEDTVNYTGKGWATFRFGRESADKALLVAAVGVRPMEIWVRLGDLSEKTWVRGHVGIAPLMTTPA
jgi:hypothetical protein